MSEGIPVIETERLRLRGRTVEDFPFIRGMWREPEVVRLISGKPLTEEESWTKFLRMLGHWPALGYGYWLAEERDSGQLVGEVGFAEFRREITPSLQGEPELGYAFSSAFHGRGYASEAALAAVAWGDDHLPGAKMSCIVAMKNAPSIRVAEKCGFVTTMQTVYHGGEVCLLHRPIGRRI